jgi:hypothetical protein
MVGGSSTSISWAWRWKTCCATSKKYEVRGNRVGGSPHRRIVGKFDDSYAVVRAIYAIRVQSQDPAHAPGHYWRQWSAPSPAPADSARMRR